MFQIGDEVQYVGNDEDCPLKKTDVFVVAGFYPVGTPFGGGKWADPVISIGLENEMFREAVNCTGITLPHYDCWKATEFRKVEKKRDRAELYTLLGITDMLNGKARELTHV